MRKVVIGYIFGTAKPGEDERIFLRLAKRKGIEIVLFSTFDEADEKEIEEKAKRCDIIYNSNADDFALELAKTMEGLGKKVVDSPKAYYYTEDKWMFFVKCREHGIPVPETILLSEDINEAKKELKKFNRWPVVLKRVSGCQGEFVERVGNQKEAMKIIRRFWRKGSERMPIIAQEFIKSHNYRVLVIGGRIVQTVLKKGRSWKATGAWAKRHNRFKADAELKKIVEKTIKLAGINICGIDLVKKDGKWVVLEVNSEPTFGFIECDRERLVNEALDFLKGYAKKIHNL